MPIRRLRRRHVKSRARRFGLAIMLGGMVLSGPTVAAETLHDPMQPSGWGERAAPVSQFDASAWTLESTLVSNGRRVAVINGRAVRAGDRVAGARVLRVDPGRARLNFEGRRFTVQRPTIQVHKR